MSLVNELCSAICSALQNSSISLGIKLYAVRTFGPTCSLAQILLVVYANVTYNIPDTPAVFILYFMTTILINFRFVFLSIFLDGGSYYTLFNISNVILCIIIYLFFSY